jgi:hypothetical protein
MQAAPVIKSFLIADSVFQTGDGKWCVIGVFEKIYSPRFPCMHYTLGVFMKLADAEGNYSVVVELHDSSDRCLARMSPLKLHVTDRTAELDFGIQTFGLFLPSPGVYFLKVFFNGEPAHPDIRFEACLVEGSPV